MCTVSFVSLPDSVVITSNRDEHIQRANAAAPGFHVVRNRKIIFPKDDKAGGTWFAATENGVVAVLLNGAFEKHVPRPPYRQSRGLILLDIAAADDPFLFFRSINLDNIEPFTIILYQQHSLYGLMWDGSQKHEKPLNSSGNYIWSSSTLYTAEIIELRKNLFEQFISSEDKITVETIHHFHTYNYGDEENGFVINRQTGMKTFSITQAVIKSQSIDFLHTDLLNNRQYKEIVHIKPVPENSREKF